ncbi:MAG TPA: MarR family transcriptional regulator [Paraburkholderia sp.]|nr:MarR family transcriptional regulator [Paraburkholderia sp.]
MPRGNKDAIVKIERAMHQIVRDLGSRNLGRKAERQLDNLVGLSHVAVVDALTASAEGAAAATVGRIAKKIDVDPSRASRMVQAFIKAGYARRVALQSDARHVQVELTDQGRKFARSIADLRLNYFKAHLKRWSPKERDDFARLLAKFAGDMSGHADSAAVATPITAESFGEGKRAVNRPVVTGNVIYKLRRAAQ